MEEVFENKSILSKSLKQGHISRPSSGNSKLRKPNFESYFQDDNVEVVLNKVGKNVRVFQRANGIQDPVYYEIRGLPNNKFFDLLYSNRQSLNKTLEEYSKMNFENLNTEGHQDQEEEILVNGRKVRDSIIIIDKQGRWELRASGGVKKKKGAREEYVLEFSNNFGRDGNRKIINNKYK